jgi:hypothetical protein
MRRPLGDLEIARNVPDGRAMLSTADKENWEAAHHPKLAFLAEMILDLAAEEGPEYTKAGHIPLRGTFWMVAGPLCRPPVHSYRPLSGIGRARSRTEGSGRPRVNHLPFVYNRVQFDLLFPELRCA